MLRKAGFTLVELLTTLAILSVLAAIIFPVFARVREQARALSCLSNIRQIGASTLLYQQDYDEVLIPWRNSQDDLPVDLQIAACWTMTVQPYLGSRGVFVCPSFNMAATAKAMDESTCDGKGTPGSGSTGFNPPAQILAHYGISLPLTFGTCTQQDPYARYAGSGWLNAAYPGLPDGAPVFSAGPLASVVDPARTAFVADGLTAVRSDLPQVGVLFGCEGRFRHKDNGCNLFFLDGHTRYLVSDPEAIVDQDSAGCWYERYYTADR